MALSEYNLQNYPDGKLVPGDALRDRLPLMRLPGSKFKFPQEIIRDLQSDIENEVEWFHKNCSLELKSKEAV